MMFLRFIAPVSLYLLSELVSKGSIHSLSQHTTWPVYSYSSLSLFRSCKISKSTSRDSETFIITFTCFCILAESIAMSLSYPLWYDNNAASLSFTSCLTLETDSGRLPRA
jgi:hypothetical protein